MLVSQEKQDPLFIAKILSTHVLSKDTVICLMDKMQFSCALLSMHLILWKGLLKCKYESFEYPGDY